MHIGKMCVGIIANDMFCHIGTHSKPKPQNKPQHMQPTTTKEITRTDFMNFFRDNDKLDLLSVDDKIEVFSTILLGSCDFKKKLLDEIFSDYGVSHLEVIERKKD